jgi:hypothetical protein
LVARLVKEVKRLKNKIKKLKADRQKEYRMAAAFHRDGR